MSEAAGPEKQSHVFWPFVKKREAQDCNQSKLVIFIVLQEAKNYVIPRRDDVSVLMPFFLQLFEQKADLYRQWLARVSSSCASLVSPLVTKTVDPDWSVSTEGTYRNFQLFSIHLALFNKRLCHPLLIYCPPPFSCVVHSTGICSIIFARIPWPESVIQSRQWCSPISE